MSLNIFFLFLCRRHLFRFLKRAPAFENLFDNFFRISSTRQMRTISGRCFFLLPSCTKSMRLVLQSQGYCTKQLHAIFCMPYALYTFRSFDQHRLPCFYCKTKQQQVYLLIHRRTWNCESLTAEMHFFFALVIHRQLVMFMVIIKSFRCTDRWIG